MMDATVTSALDLAAWTRLLALGFTPPDAASIAEMRPLVAALRADLPEGPHAQALDDLALAIDDPDVLERAPTDYSALVDGESPCPPFEGSYEGDPFRQTRQMADVAGFYRAFGADASGPDAERPDHVACELEFLSFLALASASAHEAGRADDAVTCRTAEDTFLRDHLGRWLPTFCEGVELTTSSPLYSALARVGAGAIRRELAQRGIVCEPLGARRRWAVEAEDLTCGAAGAAGPEVDGSS